MPYYGYIWTKRARIKIDLNGVAEHEVEAVISDPMSTAVSNSSGRP